jgi:D-alanine-D-alanine ligase
METKERQFKFRDVVIVADELDPAASAEPIHQRQDLEMTDPETLNALQSAIFTLGLKVHHYDGPAALAERARFHKDDIVLTIYGGRRSRNRMALIPAVCESFGLKFIGPDVYGRIVAQDKEISKRLAVDCGLRTPAWRVIRDKQQIRYAFGIKLPFVVKPLMEGSSIGITQRNRVNTADEATLLVCELLTDFQQPVLVEEFVSGREVSYARIENAGDDGWAFSEVIIDGDPHFFNERLFDAHEKLVRTPGRTVRNIDDELNAEDRRRIEALLTAYKGYGYCRVDGRLADGKFSFLELTPDAWIAPHGQFSMGFTQKGWTYVSVIEAVLSSVD